MCTLVLMQYIYYKLYSKVEIEKGKIKINIKIIS